MRKNIHAQRLVNKRWKKVPKKERSIYGKMMVEARELRKKGNDTFSLTNPLEDGVDIGDELSTEMD